MFLDTRSSVHNNLIPADSLRFLTDRIAGDLNTFDRLGSPRATQRQDLWIDRTEKALRMLIMRPFCRLQDIADTCCCDISDAVRLVSAIHHDRESEALLTRFSADAPYRQNTIAPINESGAVASFLTGDFRYPFTVGIYPAVSCMLSCSFCGRARGVQYSQDHIAPGNALFQQLFAEAPRDLPRRFYISGGLEPLTNPGLAELIRFAAGLGHRMQLYTNAMMLTSRFLENNEGIWHLDTMRISMYGADDETAKLTTLRSGVGTRVIANASDLVRLKVQRRSNLRVGFNHVVQSGQVKHLGKIARALLSIADQSPDRKGINFLTLRENYAASGEAAIHGMEREQLRDELVALQNFFIAEGMNDFVVDLGYGMRGLVDGLETEPVRRVAHTDMLARGYPQISVVVDLLGDVYLYREAAFIGRAGADRYIIGRLTPQVGLTETLSRFCTDRDRFVVPQPGDEIFLDAFDHAVTAFLRQASDDLHFGTHLSGIPVPAGLYQDPANLWR